MNTLKIFTIILFTFSISACQTTKENQADTSDVNSFLSNQKQNITISKNSTIGIIIQTSDQEKSLSIENQIAGMLNGSVQTKHQTTEAIFGGKEYLAQTFKNIGKKENPDYIIIIGMASQNKSIEHGSDCYRTNSGVSCDSNSSNLENSGVYVMLLNNKGLVYEARIQHQTGGNDNNTVFGILSTLTENMTDDILTSIINDLTHKRIITPPEED